MPKYYIQITKVQTKTKRHSEKDDRKHKKNQSDDRLQIELKNAVSTYKT